MTPSTAAARSAPATVPVDHEHGPESHPTDAPLAAVAPRRPLAPAARLLGALALALLSAAVCTVAATRAPWLGLAFTRTTAGVQPVLAAPAPGSAAERAGVRAGETLVSLAPDGGAAIPVGAGDLLEEPDVLDTWPEVDAFFARQSRLRAALDAPRVTLGLRAPDGAARPAPLAPAPHRPVASLPLVFWLQLAFGAVGCVVGAWVWALRPHDWGARAYAVTGACFLLFAHAAAVYSARELALPGAAFRALSGLNHLGATLFGAALCALFLCYPRRLVGAGTLAALGAVAVAWWGANVTRLAPDQDWASRFPVLLAMLGAIAIAGVQWWRARGDPAARAVLRWFIASVLVGCGLFVGTTAAVSAWGETPAIPQGYAFGFFVLMYAGLAAGLRRHRLFELDEWALRVLFWALALALVAGLDVVLLATMGTGTARTGTLVLLLALATLPLRRLVWTRVLHRAPPDAELLVSRSLAVAYAASDAERADRWRGLLGELFDPLGVTVDARAVGDARADAQLDEEGIALRVPAVASAPALRLTHAGGGRRLFGAADARLATTLAGLMRAADDSRHAFEAGVRGERTRIARDLHDTVSSPLLAGLARANDADVRRDIRRAVHEMRTVVSGDAVEPAPLADCVADARYAAVERLSAHGLAVEWPLADVGDHQLTADQRTAFAAFVQEAVTNVLQHARATRVDVGVSVGGGTLTCRIEDDGRGVDAARRDDGARDDGARDAAPRRAGAGQGIPNLHARAATLGGHAFVSPRAGRAGTTVLLVARLAPPPPA